MSTEDSRNAEQRACRELRPLLEDFVDDELTGARGAAVRRHVEGCEGCRREVAAIERLVVRARELPESLAPGRDLWPGVAARLARRRPRRQDTGRLAGWTLQAVAAVLLIAFGGLLSQLLWPSARPRIAELEGVGERAAELAAGECRAELASAEAEYLRVKESLWLLVYRHRALLSPTTVEVVEDNLRTLDSAIHEIRRALEDDPGNRQLEGLLFANHRRSLHLLRRLASVPQEI